MTTVAQMSEGQLLALFLPILAAHNQQVADVRAKKDVPGALVLGPGDDSAVLDLRGGLTVMSTDTQTENQDFRQHWPSGYSTGGYEVGWKAATQNLADIAAMGATPITLLVSLTLTPDTPTSWVQDFARGITESCTAQGASTCTIAGGDMGSGSEISVTVTAVGLTDRPITRSGAQPGEAIVFAGALGIAAAGLALLDSQPFTATQELSTCVLAQQRPRSPLALGASAAPYLTSLMDVSDGLVRDSGRIAAASGVALDLNSAALAPWAQKVHPAAALLTGGQPERAEAQALRWVLTGGEDHGLLGTCPPEQIPPGFTRIGTVQTGDGITLDGRTYTAKGWDHFEAGSR
ncbi:MAG: thiamine-phosphate kinase [Rothia sp. (in: high G+C Gram-positive bacteria)]|nr:thiamine-phosphate kinase [Rothia sp. (in: high G+C Gram-positive bacteria)]